MATSGDPGSVVEEAVDNAWPAGLFRDVMGSLPELERPGQPCIRGLRITVWDVLGWLAAGKTEDQIIEDYPELEKGDFRAVYDYAAALR